MIHRRAIAATLAIAATVAAAPPADPCAQIAGKTFVPTTDLLSCYKSFPLNETIRDNILTNAERVLNFFTFEDYYAKSPFPYQESTLDIRGELKRIRRTKYANDFDFQSDLYWTVIKLNDGHTRFRPNCYAVYQNILPAPIVSIEVKGKQGVYIAPNAAEFLSLYGPAFEAHFQSINFDWKRLAGAQVLTIEGLPAYDYVDRVASTQSGNFLDHGIRVNSVYSSVRIVNNVYTQRNGDLALEALPKHTSLTFTVVLPGKILPEIVKIPFVAAYTGAPFTDKASFWQTNCVATGATNGVDVTTEGSGFDSTPKQQRIKADIMDATPSGVDLPTKYQPTLPPTPGSGGVIKSYVLPGNKTGVMFVGSFGGDSFYGFQSDVVAAINQIKAAGATQLIIDLTGNGGGYVCLGHYLHRYLGGANVTFAGHESSARANPLAKKVVAGQIARGLDANLLFYPGDNWAFLNGTQMPSTYNYMEPSLKTRISNGRIYEESQRFHDTCELAFQEPLTEAPPFELKNIKIVTNGWCASTCAMFSSLLYEKFGTTIAAFGGRPGQYLAFSGMAGNQVLEWPSLDTEIKSAGVKNDPLAPPDFITNANFRVNWRTAYSWVEANEPIAYRYMPPHLRFAYTNETYINPQNLWLFAEKTLFK